MECREIIFSRHAVDRMFQRGIKPVDIRVVIESGEVVADYPDDFPFPSCLIVGTASGRTLHAVIAIDRQRHRCYVITAYPPDPDLWSADFRKRRES